MFWPPGRSASRSNPSLRNCKEPTYPLGWGPCPCPAQPCKHSGTLHLTSFPRVCLCLSAYPSLTASRHGDRVERVCLCVGFLTFSSRSSIVPTSPATSPSCLPPPFLSHPFFFRPCPVASPSLLILLLLLLLLSRFPSLVKTIPTHHSFPPPVQLNSHFCFENVSPGKQTRYPLHTLHRQPPKKHRHFIPSRIIPAQLNLSGNSQNVRLRAPGLS